MAQPVKKKIIEKHPELENKPFYTLIVDGTNLLRICFSDDKINENGFVAEKPNLELHRKSRSWYESEREFHCGV